MVGWLVNNELKKVAQSEVVFWHLPVGTEENQWKPQLWQPAKIWSQDLSNMKQECQPLHRDIWLCGVISMNSWARAPCIHLNLWT
jgi:hypothetical protein